jgi:hypothetical protein
MPPAGQQGGRFQRRSHERTQFGHRLAGAGYCHRLTASDTVDDLTAVVAQLTNVISLTTALSHM